MKRFACLPPGIGRAMAIGVIAIWWPLHAAAQSFCASDGQPQPLQLVERFINADCATCWTNTSTNQPAARAVALDWVLPGSLGDEAPLAAVASRDGLVRMEALQQAPPNASAVVVRPIQGSPAKTLRVAHGLPVSDYLGVSIELKPAPSPAKAWIAWLALVETLPAGTEGSPVERNLVRNLLSRTLDKPEQLSKTEQKRFFESRSMYIAPGVKADRLRVIGWLENDKGQVIAAAQSRCDGGQ